MTDPRSGGTPAAAPPSEALTRSRIEHWLRNRCLRLRADFDQHTLGYGETVTILMALLDDLAEYAGALSGVAPEPSEAALDVLRAEVASLREAAQLVVDECLPDQPPSLGSIEKLRGALAPASREPTP